MEIELEVFFHSEDTLQKKNAGMEYSVLECDARKRTFYVIESISPYFDDESETWLCSIISAGTEYIAATKSYEEIKQLIHESNAG